MLYFIPTFENTISFSSNMYIGVFFCLLLWWQATKNYICAHMRMTTRLTSLRLISDVSCKKDFERSHKIQNKICHARTVQWRLRRRFFNSGFIVTYILRYPNPDMQSLLYNCTTLVFWKFVVKVINISTYIVRKTSVYYIENWVLRILQ